MAEERFNPIPQRTLDPRQLPLGMRRRNAYGRSPINARVLPLQLLRSTHALLREPDTLEEGVEAFREAMDGTPPPAYLPQRMAFAWHKADPDGGGPARGPRQSAASLAWAIAATGRLDRFVNQMSLTPANPQAAELRARVATFLSPQSVSPGDTIPQSPGRQVSQTVMPTQEAMIAAYGDAAEIVESSAVLRRQSLIGRAMAEINAQSRRVLLQVRGQQVTAADGEV